MDTSIVTLLSILFIVLVIAIGVLVFFLIGKSEEIKTMQASHDKLMRSFNDLDEQAKLIVKTDLELNKAQEELDKRLHGLNILQKTTREISKTLDEKEIYEKINQQLINDLGFSRALLMRFEDRTQGARVNIGFTDDKIAYIYTQFEKDEHFKTALKQGHTFSSNNSSKQTKEKIIQIFGVEHFILAPILIQNGLVGILLVGNRYNAPAVTQGDEELISILANQLGQSLENTQLFEQVYKSSQLLETKVKDRTKELESALSKVKRISQQKSEFISAVSHELRTPLTSIKGYASILMTGKIGEIPPPVKERLGKINTHSDNLVKLINDLLDIARIESGKAEMRFKRQRIQPVVETIGDLLVPQMKDKNLKLAINLPPDLPEVFVDNSHIDRVFINLCSNAIKYTMQDGTVTISARNDPDNEELIFSVSDTGIGIKEDDLQRLFEEFFRVDSDYNKTVKGTGLGLSLVKNIVEAHKGRIWVTSKVGEGTTFNFTLPTTDKKFNIPESKTEKQV